MVLWYSTHQIVWSMSGVYSFLATVITAYLIYGHLRNWTEPRFQKPIVRILLMVPIYAIDSWLSIVFFQLSVFFDVARDCYEAYAIYEFFILLVQFMGGEECLIQMLSEKEDLKHPWPLCCLPPLTMGKGFFLLCKRMVMQFVIIKPILAGITFVLELFHVYDEGSFSFTSGYLYVTTLDNISITFALYFLVLFYMPIWNELQPFRPLPKFLCIKTVIFFSFWQGVVVAFLVWINVIQPEENYTVENLSAFIQDALICVEMFVLSLAMNYAFNPDMYLDPNADSLISNPSGVIPIFKNLKTVISVKDVVADTVDTFGREIINNNNNNNSSNIHNRHSSDSD